MYSPTQLVTNHDGSLKASFGMYFVLAFVHYISQDHAAAPRYSQPSDYNNEAKVTDVNVLKFYFPTKDP
jgi:hypothetical protein